MGEDHEGTSHALELPPGVRMEIVSGKEELLAYDAPLRAYLDHEREIDIRRLAENPTKEVKQQIWWDADNRRYVIKLLPLAIYQPEFSGELLLLKKGEEVIGFSMTTFNHESNLESEKVNQTLVSVGQEHQRKGLATYLVNRRNERLRDIYHLDAYVTDVTNTSRKIFEKLQDRFPIRVLEEGEGGYTSTLRVSLQR